MNNRKKYLFSSLVIILLLVWIHFQATKKEDDLKGLVKIAIRDIGHKLLLSDKDSTSLVLPIIALNSTAFELSFDTKLSIDPGELVAIVQKSLKKASLSENYRVEVRHCLVNEIAFSYEMKRNINNAIIPCKGRTLPNKCYVIKIQFLKNTISFLNEKLLMYLLLFVISILLFIDFNKKKNVKINKENNSDFIAIGSFQFYPEQNKLVKDTLETALSNKERELLSVFIASPNQIIKREVLTKKVWEDNGVFVSRSLDTYISKLRKKLIADDSIKLTNIHGVGYRLEVKKE